MAGTAFVLRSTCQVREEHFGLLFYNSIGPKLLFAETGSLLPGDFFEQSSGQQQWIDALSPAESKKIVSFLGQLVTKGFLDEQPIC